MKTPLSVLSKSQPTLIQQKQETHNPTPFFYFPSTPNHCCAAPHNSETLIFSACLSYLMFAGKQSNN